MQKENVKFNHEKCTSFVCLKLKQKQSLSLKAHWEYFKIGGVQSEGKNDLDVKKNVFLR